MVKGVKTLKDIHKLRYWCQIILPLVYDDSLSYYELLNKVVDYLNKVIDKTNDMSAKVEELDATVEDIKKAVHFLKNTAAIPSH